MSKFWHDLREHFSFDEEFNEGNFDLKIAEFCGFMVELCGLFALILFPLALLAWICGW